MDNITYNIPLNLVREYTGRRVVVRSAAPTEIAQRLAGQLDVSLQYIQLLTADIGPDEIEVLSRWAPGIPLDVVLSDPGTDFALLYNFSKLTDRHSVRVSIPVKPGFINAVKLALALHFAVKLDPGQPDQDLIDELAAALDLYLYRTTVTQPVEFFHSLFLSCFDQTPVSLWDIQEQDPERFRFVTDDGIEMVLPSVGGPTLRNGTRGTTSVHECETCQFAAGCRGYFKWPDSNYDCTGIKNIFASIDSAAARLRNDVVAAAAAANGGRS